MLEIDVVGGFCPCQGEGWFDGNPFYFRARHGYWQLDVSHPNSDPVDASLNDQPALYRAEGDDPENGYMLPEIATAIITKHYNIFIGTEHP